jgi:hypothetical protein
MSLVLVMVGLYRFTTYDGERYRYTSSEFLHDQNNTQSFDPENIFHIGEMADKVMRRGKKSEHNYKKHNMGTSSMTKASKPTPKQNHPDQLDLIDYINAKEAEDKFVSVRTNTTKGE